MERRAPRRPSWVLRVCTTPPIAPMPPPPKQLQALPEMLRSASLAAQKGMGPDEAYVRNMLGFVWGPLLDAIPKVGGLDGGACHAVRICVAAAFWALRGPRCWMPFPR